MTAFPTAQIQGAAELDPVAAIDLAQIVRIEAVPSGSAMNHRMGAAGVGPFLSLQRKCEKAPRDDAQRNLLPDGAVDLNALPPLALREN